MPSVSLYLGVNNLYLHYDKKRWTVQLHHLALPLLVQQRQPEAVHWAFSSCW